MAPTSEPAPGSDEQNDASSGSSGVPNIWGSPSPSRLGGEHLHGVEADLGRLLDDRPRCFLALIPLRRCRAHHRRRELMDPVPDLDHVLGQFKRKRHSNSSFRGRRSAGEQLYADTYQPVSTSGCGVPHSTALPEWRCGTGQHQAAPAPKVEAWIAWIASSKSRRVSRRSPPRYAAAWSPSSRWPTSSCS